MELYIIPMMFGCNNIMKWRIFKRIYVRELSWEKLYLDKLFESFFFIDNNYLNENVLE